MLSIRIDSAAATLVTLFFFMTVATSRPLAAAGGEEVIRGPVWSGTVRGKGRDATVAMKGLAITLSSKEKAYICYDSDLMRPSLAWTGEFLDFGNTLTKIEWPPPPQVKGTPVFSTKEAPGFSMGDDYGDPRPRHQGPLPKDLAHYSGLYVDGDKVVLRYTVGTGEVYELPGFREASGLKLFTRTLRVRGAKAPLSIALSKLAGDGGSATDLKVTQEGATTVIVSGSAPRLAIGITGGSGKAIVDLDNQLWFKLTRLSRDTRLKITLAGISSDTEMETFRSLMRQSGEVEDLMVHCKGGPARWGAPVETKGAVGEGDGPYLVDSLSEPVPNPWNARTFFGGFDFFPDGRAAICTFHGDVWVVSGLDQTLNKLSWKRVAVGLFQPLGLKVVKNQIYVLGRDQITRLHDLNKDGEMDYYENFNNDTIVTQNYHEFCLDLHTDSEGNFFFAKGAPWTPDVTSPHQGTLIKVSKDGRRMEVYATGFRAPNGSSIGPRDEITVSDNQGHWMPSSKVNWVKKGGFYGMTPSAAFAEDDTWRHQFRCEPKRRRLPEDLSLQGLG